MKFEWGSLETVEKVIDSLALQSNKLGHLLSGGVYSAACLLEEEKGIPALQYALYGKGGSPFNEDVRSRPSWATNMAVASRGADHLRGYGTLDAIYRPDISQLYFGTPDGAKPLDLTLKGASSVMGENRAAVVNSLGLCVFPVGADPVRYPLSMFAEALFALTGAELSEEQLKVAGERIVNLEKAFNSRLGYRRSDDRLCERWLRERKPNDPGAGWKAEDYLEQLKDEYYHMRGWDQDTGLQGRDRLDELGMSDVAEILATEGALA